MIDEDRLKHSVAVARKMVEIGKEYKLSNDKLQDLFVLGLNHDIGYEFGENSNHTIIGGDILKRNNYKYWHEVLNHGQVDSEYKSIFLEILNKADMQIDKYGKDVGYENRLEDIKERYGENSNIYKKAKILIDNLKKKE